MPYRPSAAPELSSLLDGSSAGELIPDLARNGLQQLIELELTALVSVQGSGQHAANSVSSEPLTAA